MKREQEQNFEEGALQVPEGWVTYGDETEVKAAIPELYLNFLRQQYGEEVGLSFPDKSP